MKQRSFCSSICNKNFKSSSSVLNHKKSLHESIKFNCNFCEYSFTTKENLQQHTNSIHFHQKYPCAKCDFQAATEGTLWRHNKNIHQTKENVICHDCNKSMKPHCLNKHRRLFHSGVQMYRI